MEPNDINMIPAKRLRRKVLLVLYQIFRAHPYAAVELSEIQEQCGTTPAELNWNLVYLEKCALVELATAMDNPPYVACSVSLTAAGIDLIENESKFNRRFADANPPG